MATEKQIAANQANSMSAGVKTEGGKLRSRFNSYKHGLSSKILISNFNTLKEAENGLGLIFDSLCESLKPTNPLEEELIHKMALSIMKAERCEILERDSFKEDLDFNSHKWELMPGQNFELALKYKGSVENTFYRALDALLKLRQVQQLDLFWKRADE